MFMKNLGIDREEFLETVVSQYVYAKSNYKNTLLGEPMEIARARGILDGVCMTLALEYEIKNREIIFKTFDSNKMILKLPFDPLEPF